MAHFLIRTTHLISYLKDFPFLQFLPYLLIRLPSQVHPSLEDLPAEETNERVEIVEFEVVAAAVAAYFASSFEIY